MTMSLSPVRFAVLALLWLAGCGSPPPPAAAPEPEPEPVVEPEPAAVPQIPLEERVQAPFAVQSDGRTAPRTPRGDLVILERAPAPDPTAAPRATPPPATAAGDRPAPASPTPAAAQPANRTAAPATAGTAAAGAAAQRPAGPRQHTVETGETFYGIARQYGVTPSALGAVNPGIDSDRLRAGQVLQLPAYATRAPAQGQTAATPAPVPDRPTPAPAPRTGQQAAQRPAAQQRTHRVASGETLWSIARRYGVTTDQIRAANRLTSDTVRIGQTLVIPNS
jgi:LysM repeat protein